MDLYAINVQDWKDSKMINNYKFLYKILKDLVV